MRPYGTLLYTAKGTIVVIIGTIIAASATSSTTVVTMRNIDHSTDTVVVLLE